MAACFTSKQNYPEANECLSKSMGLEDQEIAKVALYTKIAGNYKKAEDKDKSLESIKKAHDLAEKIGGKKDLYTCKCLINYGDVQYYFELTEEAKATYQQFLDLFEENKDEWEE